MQTSRFAVCDIGLFGKDIRYFYTDNLDKLLEKFPWLEFPHKQSFYLLMYITQASGEIIIDEYRIRLDQAKAIIIKPGCISNININRKAQGKIICFTDDFFSLRYHDNVLSGFSFLHTESPPYIRLDDVQQERICTFLGLLSEEFESQRTESSKVLRSYLNIVMFEIERLFHPYDFPRNKSLKHEKIIQFEALINNNFASKKRPHSYADLLNVTPNYLNKICKEETGYTAGEFIRKRVVTEARRLLHHTYYTVGEIADRLGFESSSYFTTFFKKNTGITPEEFRKKTD